MKGQMYFRLVAVFLLEVLVSVLATDNETYVAVGGSLSLRPPEASSARIYNIVWKYNGNLVLEWVEGKVDLVFYDTFRNRSKLDTTNGHLEVKHMTKDDSGIYSAEINNRVQTDRYDVKVIRAVPVPEVRTKPLACGTGSDKDKCTLACDGVESITDAEPITYRWKRDGQMLQNTTANIIITNDEETRRVKTYSCLMKNPVGEKESNAHNNPFFKKEPSDFQAGLIAFLVIVFFALGIAVLAWKKQNAIRGWFNLQPQQDTGRNNPTKDSMADTAEPDTTTKMIGDGNP